MMTLLCHRRISLRVKGKVYKTVVRPAMMYGAETWAVKKAQEKKLDVAEMRMLRWMSGVTKMDRIRNERNKRTKVRDISRKVQESGIQPIQKIYTVPDTWVQIHIASRRRRQPLESHRRMFRRHSPLVVRFVSQARLKCRRNIPRLLVLLRFLRLCTHLAVVQETTK